jgi:large subunit ribosomal protein L3
LNNKSLLGFFKKQAAPVFKVLREFRNETAEVGADLDVNQFKAGDVLLVQGFSKGRGWTSVIKKWNFGTGRESHGGNCQRKMGSSGMHTWPAHVIKGKKMSGRWSLERVTLRSVEVIDVVPEENLLLLKGPLPGTPGSLVRLQKLGEKKKAAPKKKDEAA